MRTVRQAMTSDRMCVESVAQTLECRVSLSVSFDIKTVLEFNISGPHIFGAHEEGWGVGCITSI